MTSAVAGSPGADGAAGGRERLPVEIPHERFVLDNGLTLLVHEDPSRPTVAVNVWYHVGSKDERPGRTGFAHLFEHLMFEGSAHAPPGAFDELLERVGGVNNGSTNPDRTNYWENVPPTALELAFWLESDRMGWLLEALDQEKFDIQRDVVMNERRQSYENRPYGLAFETLLEMLFAEGHPYSWPTIGSMEDLERATLDDVRTFFRKHYAPSNASVAVAGRVRKGDVLELARRYFEPVPSRSAPEAVRAEPGALPGERRRILEDDVHLPRLYLAWHTPEVFTDEDGLMDLVADVLADGKGARIHRRLVYEEELAQDVTAFQDSGELGSVFHLVLTARPGVDLGRLEEGALRELEELVRDGPGPGSVEGSVASLEASFVRRLDRMGGFGGRADALNEYHHLAGASDFAARDLKRYGSATAEGVRAAVRRYLIERPRAVLSVVPRDRRELAAGPERSA